ncbi:MAG: SGNH/GDSL hydrolase family protein [Pseudonocardia sp.]|nr:SGNH/GDSL hydrolase family protein [Pseudonocardia sp.]
MWVRRVARVAVAMTVGTGLALLGAGVSHADPAPSSGEYVALGDSYVAGPLILAPTGQPAGCLRSDRDYPSLVRAGLRTATFTDVSCGGATTADMTAPQPVTGGANPPQLGAVTGRTALVTLGIGGNDIGFAEIITTCATRSSAQPLGAACRDFYHQGGRDQLAERIQRTAPKVAAVLHEIDKRAPRAKVLVVGYPTILPDSGPGCYPVVPFSAGDVAYLRATEKALNAMLAAQAARAGAVFVDTYRSSVGHDICQLPGTKWVEGLVPTAPAAPVHPNELGMRHSANRVLVALHVSPSPGS